MFNEENKFLPYSGRRYVINQYGEIFNSLGEIINTEELDDEILVEIDWLFGKKKYSLGILVYLTFKQISLKDYLWDKLLPTYIDGNNKNNSPSNLRYKFVSGKLEVEEYPGFYYIPYYTNYAINIGGDVINVTTGNKMSWYITKPILERNTKGGYYGTRIVNDFGNSTNLLRHRAISLVFKDYSPTFEKMVVNHLNGIPGDDRPENLEWTTVSENNKHAYLNGLCPNKSKPILMKNLKTNVIISFDSVVACSKYLGYEKDTFISYRLKFSPNKVFEDMLMFKYDDGSDWPDVDVLKSRITRNGITSEIMARNVFTGDIIVFSGAEQGESLLGIKACTIARHVRENALIPFKGYNFRYVVGGEPWPTHTERHLICYRKNPLSPPDGVIVKDITSGKEYFYTSREDVAKEYNISIANVWSIANQQKIFKDKYIFSLFKLNEALRSS